MIVEKFCTLIKIGQWTTLFEEESDTVFLSNVWHHPYFHHVMLWVPVIACSVIRKDFVTRYDSQHIYLCALSGMLCCCMRICQASSLNATCDKKSLLTEIFFVISVQNVGHCTPSCDLRCSYKCFAPMWLWNAEFLASMSVYSHFSSSEASWTFSFVAETVQSISGLSCTYVLHSPFSKYYYI